RAWAAPESDPARTARTWSSPRTPGAAGPTVPEATARRPAAAWPGWKAPRRGDAGGRAGCATGCSWALLVSVVVGGCPGVGWAGRRGWAGLPERCGPAAARQLLGILRAPHRRG